MRVLWAEGGSLSPRAVQGKLSTRTLAYTTVMTVMVRLWEKGQLIREKTGRTYRYSPAYPAAEVVASNMAGLLAEMDDPRAVFAHFANGLSRDEVEALKRILADR